MTNSKISVNFTIGPFYELKNNYLLQCFLKKPQCTKYPNIYFKLCYSLGCLIVDYNYKIIPFHSNCIKINLKWWIHKLIRKLCERKWSIGILFKFITANIWSDFFKKKLMPAIIFRLLNKMLCLKWVKSYLQDTDTWNRFK